MKKWSPYEKIYQGVLYCSEYEKYDLLVTKQISVESIFKHVHILNVEQLCSKKSRKNSTFFILKLIEE